MCTSIARIAVSVVDRDAARPSVKELNPCNAGETFTPVAAPRQPKMRSGFPSGICLVLRENGHIASAVAIARSTGSGFPEAAVKYLDKTYIDSRACPHARLPRPDSNESGRFFISEVMS
jgi:hypothetical protein